MCKAIGEGDPLFVLLMFVVMPMEDNKKVTSAHAQLVHSHYLFALTFAFDWLMMQHITVCEIRKRSCYK